MRFAQASVIVVGFLKNLLCYNNRLISKLYYSMSKWVQHAIRFSSQKLSVQFISTQVAYQNPSDHIDMPFRLLAQIWFYNLQLLLAQSEPTPTRTQLQDGWYVDRKHFFIVFLSQVITRLVSFVMCHDGFPMDGALVGAGSHIPLLLTTSQPWKWQSWCWMLAKIECRLPQYPGIF